jgi:hypothetical protein
VTSNRTSDKELAFLQDIFIAPDWGERFAELIDEHVKLPKEGKAPLRRRRYWRTCNGTVRSAPVKNWSYAALTKTRNARSWHEQKATATSEQILSPLRHPINSTLSDNSFDLVIGNASLVSRQRVRKVLSELVRVAAPGATIALTLPTASSFGEFFSIYWEALHNNGLIDHESTSNS